MSGDSRAKMVSSAAALIGAQGVTATSFSEVLSASGAPRGSIYHHFPDGKRQLAQDALSWTSDRVLAYQRAVAPQTPEEVLRRFIGMWRRVVVESDGRAGCVVAGVALDTAHDDDLILVVRSAFRAWTKLLSSQLHATGIPARRAASIATTVLAGMEGALILCRAEGGPAPLDAVAAELMRLLG